MEKQANLFLVGAMKAGTTLLMDLLSQHPEIYVSPIKEPNFFVEAIPEELYDPSRFFSLEKYFKKDFPNPLHIANVNSLQDYKKLFSLSTHEKYRLEGSTMYLHAPNTPQRIYQYNNDATIIVIKRDPLDRAYSHYNMLTGLSRELRSFESRMNDEIKAYESNTLPWHSCLGMSCYNKAIEHYKKHFKQVIEIDFESLSKTPDLALEKLFEALHLKPIHLEKVGKENTGRNLKFKSFFFYLKRLGIKDVFSKVFPSNFKRWLFKSLSTTKSKEIPLSHTTKQQLLEIFEKESL